MAERTSWRARWLNVIVSNADTIASAAKLFIPATAVAVVTGWATSAMGLFQQAAPASWVYAALAGWVLTIASLALLAYARGRTQLTRFRQDVFDHTRINPLAAHFTNERIRMVDLAPPVGAMIRGKAFIDCEIIGPANVMFDNCNFQQNSGEIVDAIVIKPGLLPKNGFGFQNCTFQRCRFYLVTFMVPEPNLSSFMAWNWTGLNWITELPGQAEPPLPLPPPQPQPPPEGPRDDGR
jgi:hypothetical protein